MSIKKSESQQYFEMIFTRSCGIPFRQIRKEEYEQTVITKQQAEDFSQFLENDIEPFYYKALLSYIEAISSLENNLYSWATVRLYYSVFYAIRAYLACRNVAILRAERRLFYIKAQEGEKFKKCKDQTDHKGTIYTLEKLFSDDDILCSNKIDGQDVYQWMMGKREEVNYKDIIFHDPCPPDFWEKIYVDLKSQSMKTIIDKLVDDNWLYCFQEEYAILGIPTKRLIQTVDAIHRLGKTYNVDNIKQEFINDFADRLSDNAKQALIIWNR